MKYIRKLAKSYPYTYENPPICKVELWDFSRANENNESRKEAVTTVASISHGNEFAKNPDRLWDLLIERGEESPFEFVRAFGKTLRQGLDAWDNIKEPIKQILIKRTKESNATFKLKVPIFVARQIMRHRAFSFMEMSRRYVKGNRIPFEFWNKKEICYLIAYSINLLCPYDSSEDFYSIAIQKGFKPEQARAFLPLGLYTQFWMQGNYEAWLNFFIQRLHPEAQEETRLVALSMWNLLKKYQPETIITMSSYLDIWIEDCNPMFKPAREKRAKWFKANYLEGRDENIY